MSDGAAKRGMARTKNRTLMDPVNQVMVVRGETRVESGVSMIRRTGKVLFTSLATQALLEWAEGWLPPLRYLHTRLYEREFARVVPWARRFFGVYATFEDAMRAAPAGKPIGYDNPAAASFMQPSAALMPSDYPVLFWLEKALANSPRLLDIGGYVGISYYSYRNYIRYPENLEWIIHDVPAVAKAGVEIARHQDSRGLSFTTEITSDLRPQTVLAAGSLQCIEQNFPDLLMRMGTLPANIILNKTPLTDLPEFVTLQDLGPAVSPYRIFNRAKFIQSIESLGYCLVDSWANLDFSCRIPFYPHRTVPMYSGLYFKRRK
jgi:putative methyltransferase (TIGR04325 family)